MGMEQMTSKGVERLVGGRMENEASEGSEEEQN